MIARLLLTAVLVLAHGAAEAVVVSLGMGTLPSAQGWTYFVPTTGSHAGQLEASVWSIGGGTLSMNTMPSGLVSPSANLYRQDGLVNAIDPIVVTWRSRVLLSESTAPGGEGYGWSVDFADGSRGIVVGFSTNRLMLGGGPAQVFDATGFHDYRIEYTAGASTFDFFVDNVLHGTGNTIASVVNRIAFGDGSGGSNASAQMTSYTFSQVPEPAAPALAMLGAVMLLARRRRA